VIPIADNKKPDWNQIRAEYISGSISQRKLARKYGLSENTIIKKANREKWAEQRNGTYNAVTTVVQHETASIAADNAVKIEQAREAAIDAVKAGIEKLKGMHGSKITTRQKDSKGNPITVDFNLLDMVTALEKLQKMGSSYDNTNPVQVIIDV
jgi:uncharacterized protein YjcR